MYKRQLSGKINSGKAEKNSLKRLQETLEKRKDALSQDKMSGEDSNKEALDNLNRIKNQREHIVSDLNDLRERAADEKAKFSRDQEEERYLSKIVEELRILLGRLSSRVKTIEEMESNYEGYNYAVRHVMKSGLGGIHGVVADLIKVPSGYETAVETCLLYTSRCV